MNACSTLNLDNLPLPRVYTGLSRENGQGRDRTDKQTIGGEKKILLLDPRMIMMIYVRFDPLGRGCVEAEFPFAHICGLRGV